MAARVVLVDRAGDAVRLLRQLRDEVHRRLHQVHRGGGGGEVALQNISKFRDVQLVAGNSKYQMQNFTNFYSVRPNNVSVSAFRHFRRFLALSAPKQACRNTENRTISVETE